MVPDPKGKGKDGGGPGKGKGKGKGFGAGGGGFGRQTKWYCTTCDIGNVYFARFCIKCGGKKADCAAKGGIGGSELQAMAKTQRQYDAQLKEMRKELQSLKSDKKPRAWVDVVAGNNGGNNANAIAGKVAGGGGSPSPAPGDKQPPAAAAPGGKGGGGKGPGKGGKADNGGRDNALAKVLVSYQGEMVDLASLHQMLELNMQHFKEDHHTNQPWA